MIKTKEELRLYIKADRMMNTGRFRRSFGDTIKELVRPNYILRFLYCSRKYCYYTKSGGVLSKTKSLYYGVKKSRLGLKLGFSINLDDVGYGVVIPHYGTIVVGSGNTIGNYLVLHTSTCITAGNKVIGSGFYVSTGAKIIKNIYVADGISVSANSVLNSDVNEANCLWAGMPAIKIKSCEPWYLRDGQEYARRVEACEKLKSEMRL